MLLEIMGKYLLDVYDEAKKIGGLSAQIRLAILTKIPSTKAAALPDSLENMSKFQSAMEIVKKEFSKA